MSNSLEQLKASGTVSRSPVPGGGTGLEHRLRRCLSDGWQAARESTTLTENKLANAV